VFKVGDKVIAKENSAYGPLVHNQIYTIDGLNEAVRDRNGEPAYFLKEVGRKNSGFFAFRFYDKAVDASFNISTATDQELADEYRRLSEIRIPIFDEIKQRGYKCIDPNSKNVLVIHKNYQFVKTETKTTTL
jgi:hypothetical protein